MARLAILSFSLSIMISLAIIVGGCGKKMAPIPPDSLVPGEVRNFSVHQEGHALTLEWLFPRVNIEGQPLTNIQGFHILRNRERLSSTAGCPPLLHPLSKIDVAYPQVGEVQGEQVRYRDTSLEPGFRYYYQIIGYDRGDHLGQPSPIASHIWDTLPQPPVKLEAKAGDRQVMLIWPPATLLADGRPIPGQITYNVYRESQGKDFTIINTSPVAEPKFQDVSVVNDISYRYLVRTVRQVNSSSLESLDSPIQLARPEKLTPPAPVLGLVAAATEKGIELRWQAGREPDLAGYRVYRRSLAEPQFRLLTPQLNTQAYFVDRETFKGVTYYYSVTAVDKSPRANQSLPSEPVEITR